MVERTRLMYTPFDSEHTLAVVIDQIIGVGRIVAEPSHMVMTSIRVPEHILRANDSKEANVYHFAVFCNGMDKPFKVYNWFGDDKPNAKERIDQLDQERRRLIGMIEEWVIMKYRTPRLCRSYFIVDNEDFGDIDAEAQPGDIIKTP